MCIDYWLLNSQTIPDQYTTTCIDDVLDSLTRDKWFSVLDLLSSYYQIAMAEEDKEKMAFISQLGFFQFWRIGQGITGAPATFQRLMEKIVGDMNLLEVLVYLDDLIVFGRNLEEHKDFLKSFIIWQRLDWNLVWQMSILPPKGNTLDILCRPMEYCLTQPRQRQLQVGYSLGSFLGYCGYYRHFITNYAAIVRPLSELPKDYAPTQRARSLRKTTQRLTSKTPSPLIRDGTSPALRLSTRLSTALPMHLCWPLWIPTSHMSCMWMPAWKGLAPSSIRNTMRVWDQSRSPAGN